MATFLLTAVCLFGMQDEIMLDTIVNFWREKFPEADFRYSCYESDGPRGNRIHVCVPLAIEKVYLHPFSTAFLKRKQAYGEAVIGCVVNDLLLLQKPLLFTYQASKGSGDQIVECRAYVVLDEDEQRRHSP